MNSDVGVILEKEEDTQQGRYLMFEMGEEAFGIEIRYVTEIIGLQKISALPEVPDYIKGIINLRGRIIPAIDARLKFKMEPAEYTDRTCIIVVDTGSLTVGLIVDSVAEVLDIADENIAPSPDARTGVQNSYIQGIGIAGDAVKLLLDCNKLFAEEEIEQISKAK